MFRCHMYWSKKTWWTELPSAKFWPKKMKSANFLNKWLLKLRNGSYTTILCENDRGQSAMKWPIKTNSLRRFGVHLVGLDRNYLLWAASVWPNIKFGHLLLTIGPFETRNWPKATRTGQKNDSYIMTCQKLRLVGKFCLPSFFIISKLFSDKILTLRENCENRQVLRQ